MLQRTLTLDPLPRGLHLITDAVRGVVAESGAAAGLCHVFIHHTSASLLIQESADPDVRVDLEAFFARLIPDGDPLYRHVEEGPDDMPAHVRAAITPVSLTLPVIEGRLGLGTWQGIFLWEHRTRARARKITVTVQPA
jgi:secondary thiamine-phosphate synthase enzyme